MKKPTNPTSIALLALLVASAFVSCASPRPAAAADCAGCEPLRVLEHELNTIAPNDFDRMGALIDQAAEAVAHVPRAGKRFDPEQVREIVQLMLADTAYDPDNQLVQNNYLLFFRQESAFLREIERLEADRRIDGAKARRLKMMLIIGIDEAKRDAGT